MQIRRVQVEDPEGGHELSFTDWGGAGRGANRWSASTA